MRAEDDQDDVIETPEPESVTYDLTPHMDVDPVVAAWARWRDKFAELMNDGMWNVEELEDRIAAKQAIFFPGATCALVGEIILYPTGMKVMHVTWVVGEMTEVLAMAPGVESVARMMGCKRMLCEGREGWKKALADIGYDFFSVTMTKDL
jgi:hypothetical protein